MFAALMYPLSFRNPHVLSNTSIWFTHWLVSTSRWNLVSWKSVDTLMVSLTVFDSIWKSWKSFFLEHSDKNDYVYQWFQTWAYFRGVVIGFSILSSVFYRSFGNTLRQVNFNIICVILVSVDALLSVILTLCASGTTNPMTLIGELYGVKIIVWLCLIFPTYLVSKYYVFARRHGYQQIP